jgi:large subunit ribosomal protein L25
MPKQHTVASLTLEPRAEVGTTSAQRLRRIGKIPGVVYGHGEATPVAVDAKQLADLLLSGNKSKIVDATIGDKHDSVLLRRVEAHPISRRALSVDFQRVSRDEAITSNVTVVTTGTPVGVRDSGGVMDVISHSLEIKGPAQYIPDNLTIDVTELDVHQHVLAGQVTLPKDFTLITPPETVVVSVEITRALASEEAPAEAGATETPPADAPTA